jgi:hypothetical protein
MLRPLAIAHAALLALALPIAVPAADDASDAKAEEKAKDDLALTDLIKKYHEAKPAAKKTEFLQHEMIGKSATLSGSITAYKQLTYHRNGDQVQDGVIVLKVDRDEVYLKPEDDIDPKKLPYPVHFTLSGTCHVIGLADDGKVIVGQSGRLSARAAH